MLYFKVWEDLNKKKVLRALEPEKTPRNSKEFLSFRPPDLKSNSIETK